MFEICDDCGVVIERVDARLVENIATLFIDSGSRPEHAVIDIRGRYGASRNGASAN